MSPWARILRQRGVKGLEAFVNIVSHFLMRGFFGKIQFSQLRAKTSTNSIISKQTPVLAVHLAIELHTGKMC